ncbi:50S ribosomal protein L6 [Candidatus Giovannonibacteria bacterium]|nr:50S ribosomal protein L6 [Candidatus Giovannonibacteria bacterium]
MSRLAKKPIKIPEGVKIAKEGELWIFRGTKGEVQKILPENIQIETSEDGLILSIKKHTKDDKAVLGTSAALIKNAISGVSNVFEKKLEIEGVGFRAQADGDTLVLSLGFTHQVRIKMPEGISFKIEKNVLTVSGVDKEKVGKIAAEIRSKKPPEPYKGKGIHYLGEVIKRKAGKKAVASA